MQPTAARPPTAPPSWPKPATGCLPSHTPAQQVGHEYRLHETRPHLLGAGVLSSPRVSQSNHNTLLRLCSPALLLLSLRVLCLLLSPPRGHAHHLALAGAQEGGPSGPDASMLPLPTQALLAALHDHLDHNLAQPAGSALQYSKAAGQVYGAYAGMVKQLVAASGGSNPRHSDHHGIGVLIVEALRHVESTVAAATARARQRSRMLVAQA